MMVLIPNSEKKLQILHNRCLCTCILPDRHIPRIRLHEIYTIANLEMRRKMHLQLYNTQIVFLLKHIMFKQKHNLSIVNTRNVATCINDAALFTTLT